MDMTTESEMEEGDSQRECTCTMRECLDSGASALKQAGVAALMIPRELARVVSDKVIGALDPAFATHALRSLREGLLAARSFVEHEIEVADHALARVKSAPRGAADAAHEEPQPEPPAR